MTTRRKLGKGEEKEPREVKESELELEEEVEEVTTESEITEEISEEPISPEQPVEEAVEEEPKEEQKKCFARRSYWNFGRVHAKERHLSGRRKYLHISKRHCEDK